MGKVPVVSKRLEIDRYLDDQCPGGEDDQGTMQGWHWALSFGWAGKSSGLSISPTGCVGYHGGISGRAGTSNYLTSLSCR